MAGLQLPNWVSYTDFHHNPGGGRPGDFIRIYSRLLAQPRTSIPNGESGLLRKGPNTNIDHVKLTWHRSTTGNPQQPLHTQRKPAKSQRRSQWAQVQVQVLRRRRRPVRGVEASQRNHSISLNSNECSCWLCLVRCSFPEKPPSNSAKTQVNIH